MRKRRKRNKENRNYRIPESFNAFCRIVSFTAANTKRMFVVSVAWVRLITRFEFGTRIQIFKTY